MKELLLEILRALVESPEEICLKEIEGEETSFFELRCAQGDVGMVIGKNGKTISAIRTLLNAVAQQDDRSAVLEVIEV